MLECAAGGRAALPATKSQLSLVITAVASQREATQIKHCLLNAYPPDHPVTVLVYEPLTQQAGDVILLGELDQNVFLNTPVLLYLPPRQQASFTALQEIVAHLRAPEGCPWDRAQTLQSMRRRSFERMQRSDRSH